MEATQTPGSATASISGDVIEPNGTVHANTPVPGMGESTAPVIVDIFASDEEVPVPIPGTPFTVMIRRELPWREQSELEAAALRGIERSELEAAAQGKQTIILDTSKQRLMSLALRIRRWNVTRVNPATKQPEPVRLPTHLQERIQVLGELAPRWARALNKAIDDIDKENGEGEEPMPALIAPTEEQAPPKATVNGGTDAH